MTSYFASEVAKYSKSSAKIAQNGDLDN